MFVGQRKDPFVVNLGRTFDLVNLNPLAASGGTDDLADKNITTLALEVPIACLSAGSDPVIGAWTSASLRQVRLLDGTPKSGLQATEKTGGAWVQVSRLGMPLVNEVVIGLKDKDRFNGSKPKDDGQFADYVTNDAPHCRDPVRFGGREGADQPRTTSTAFATGVPGSTPANAGVRDVRA
jgi:hypothetical protein